MLCMASPLVRSGTSLCQARNIRRRHAAVRHAAAHACDETNASGALEPNHLAGSGLGRHESPDDVDAHDVFHLVWQKFKSRGFVFYASRGD